MKKIFTSLFACALLATSMIAQISVFPHVTNFDAETDCGTSCTAPCNPAGTWKNGDQYGFAQAGIDWLAHSGTTPSTATGPDFDHTTGTTGRYMYTETSGCNNLTAHLVSDVYNFASISAPRISFWYHMFGATMGTMHLDVDTSETGAWIQDVVPSWTGNVNAWQLADFSLAAFSGDDSVRIRIRMVTGTSFTSDAAVDDITVYQPLAEDLNVLGISAGGGCGNSTCTPVIITLNNSGSNPIASGTQIPVSFEINAVVVTDTFIVGTAIAAGDTLNYTFVNGCADLSGPSTVSIDGWSAWTLDPAQGNDTASVVTQGIPIISTYPYVENFEAGQSGWVINNGAVGSWAFGTPAKTTIVGAASGVNAFVTGGLSTGFYADIDASYVQGPCFDFTNVCDPIISLNVWWNAEFSWDGMNVTFSTDGGNTWQLAGAYLDPITWYTDNTIDGNPGGFQSGWSGRTSTTNGSGGWVNARHRLTGAGNMANVKIRINFGTDGSVTDDGVAFDDVRIFDGAYLGADQTVCSPSTVSLSADNGNGATSYAWSTGATTATETAATTGWYWVDVVAGTCTTRDSIYVLVMDLNSDVNLGPDTATCAGTFGLDAGYWPGATYLWSNGDTDQWVTAATSGVYSVVVVTACGTIQDSVTVTVGNLPVVNLGVDSAFCGSTVLVAGSGDTYLWSTGATTGSITATSTAAYSVTVTNISGCTASDTIAVTINSLPVVDLGADTTSCAPVVLVAGNGNDSYLWSTADTTAAITASASGSYLVTVTDSLGCSANDTVVVVINTNPTVSISGTTAFCNGDSTTLTASGADSYTWVNGPSTATNTVTPSADSTFWVVGTDMLTGCSDSASVMVTVYQSPIIAQTVTVCNGDSVVVGSNTYTASGIYMDTLSTVNGCDSIIMTTLTVDTGAVITQTLNLCTGDSVMVGSNVYDSTGVYTDTLVSAFGCDSVVVTNLTIVVANAFTQNINGCGTGYSLTVGSNTYTSAGTYTDTLMNMAGCDSIVTTNLTITIVNVNTTVSGFGYIVTATNSNPNTTYQWMNCSNGVQILGAVFQSYYATANGSFACIVTENGCPDTSLCTAVSNVGIADPSTVGSLSVYPNPTLNSVTITNTIPTEIVMYNALGEVVLAKQIQTTTTLDLIAFEAGIYFIRTSEGEMVRLVKE